MCHDIPMRIFKKLHKQEFITISSYCSTHLFWRTSPKKINVLLVNDLVFGNLSMKNILQKYGQLFVNNKLILD